MGRLAREPLLHFLLLGAALFALHRAVAGPGEAPREIVVGRGRIEALAQTFARDLAAPADSPRSSTASSPTSCATRSSTARRWRSASTGTTPSCAAACARSSSSSPKTRRPPRRPTPSCPPISPRTPDEFRREEQLTFTQIFLDPTRRGASLPGDAAALLDALRTRPASVDVETAGDGLLLEPRYVDASQRDVAQHFGPAFAEALRAQPAGAWFGPVESGYGLHLVRIDARTPGSLPELAEVREAVARDLEARRRQARLDAEYERLKSGYRIRVEPAP